MSLSKISRSTTLIGFPFGVGLVLALACTLLPAVAFGDDLSDCSQPNDMPRVLAGCTNLLQARATQYHYIAYRNRSSAYAALGDFDRAEEDYQHAIALNPQYLNSSPAKVSARQTPQ